jgi:glycosyltransferase involved in cell wall biosynthesis/peptidoglycan/xylan/chitin deacetylase (PgdA/CDA1 family)
VRGSELSARGTFAVLTYHRIGDPADGPPGIFSATPERFERQMRWLARSGRAVSIDDVLRARATGRPLPAGAVHVTFDDAYRDFAEHAWPVLRRYGVPVTLFVATDYPASGRAFWWDRLFAALRSAHGELETPVGPLALDSESDRLRAYRTLRTYVKSLPHDEAMDLVHDLVMRLRATDRDGEVMTWPELRRLADEGVAVAAHSRSHPLLNRCSPERVREEIAGSVADVRRFVGQGPPVFAFPGGGVPAGAQRVLDEAGILVAFTTGRGTNPAGAPQWLSLRRINVGPRTPLAALRLQASRRVVWGSRDGAPAPAAAGGPSEHTPSERPVAYVMSRFPRLSETFVFSEIIALERRGVPVAIFPLIRERAKVTHPEVGPLVERAQFTPFLSPAVLASNLYWLRRRPRAYLGALAAALGGTWHSRNFFVGALGIFAKTAHVARLMDDQRVRHVHCHFANHPALAGFIIRRLTGIPYSFTAHGSDLHVDRTMLAEKVAEAAFVATVSHYNRRLILETCGERFAAKVHVVRAGVDTNLFAPRMAAVPAESHALRIACVGTLHEVKGQTYLVEACRLLAEAGVDVSCTLIGGGQDQAALERQIDAAGLRGRVALAGPRTRDQIADELQRAHALCAPSVPTRRGKREGIPVVLMEGMSSGLAVVASGISGIPELVQDGVSGLLVPPRDAGALAAALRRLHDDPELRRRLGAAARERVQAEFDLEHSAAQLAQRFGMAA